MTPWHDFWPGGFWFFPFMMMIFMLVMVIVVLFLMRNFFGRDFRAPWSGRDERNVGGSDSPLEIAKRRYARGEITREEFEEIRKTIG